MTQVNPEVITEVRSKFPGTRDRSDEWIREALKATVPADDRDYFNLWTTGEPMNKIPYTFYFDPKWHWIVKYPSGEDRVVDPELWAQIFGVEKMIDGNHYLSSEVVDQFYGTLHLLVEVRWNDGMVKAVRLVAPDGDLIKDHLDRFHTALQHAL